MIDLHSYMPLAIAAQFSYYDHLHAFGVYDDVFHQNHGTTDGYVVTENTLGHMGIVFRGSDDIGDWWNNLKIKPQAEHGLEAHAGFQAEFWNVWPPMHEYIKSHFRNHKIFVTGHSKGGVFAAMACRSLMWSRIPLYLSATFGCPAFLASKDHWPKLLDTAILRFVNGSDIVVRLSERVGFLHVGHEVLLRPKCHWRFWRAVTDHPMKQYVKALSAKVCETTNHGE